MTPQAIDQVNNQALQQETRRLLEENPERFNGSRLPFFFENSEHLNVARATRQSALQSAEWLAQFLRTKDMVLVKLTVPDALLAACCLRTVSGGLNIIFRGDAGKVFNLRSLVELEHIHFD